MENLISVIGKSRFNAIQSSIAKIGKGKIETTRMWLEIGVKISEVKSLIKTHQSENPTATKVAVWEALEGCFGIKKSWGCKIIKASQLPSETLTEYFESRSANTALTCGIDDLLKYAQAQGEGEGEGDEGEGEGETTEPKQKPIVTFTARLEDLGIGSNVSLRINADGSVITSASPDDIAKAIAILQQALQPVVA